MRTQAPRVVNSSETQTSFQAEEQNAAAVWRRRRPAVARIIAPVSGSGRISRGTAFLVAPSLALTALHVVASRSAEPPLFFSKSFQLEFPSGAITAEIIPDAWSQEDDWILLRLERSLQVIPLPIAFPETLGEGTQGDSFDAYGFPDTAPNSGKAEVGQVRHYEPGDNTGRGSYLQLFCVDAAAGNGEPIHGLSGAPVLVEGAVVGLIRSALFDHQGYTLAGALYGCPITRVFENATAATLLPAPDPVRGLPGLPHCDLPPEPYRDLQPYRAVDAEIFFGRDADIRALFDIVTADDAAPIVLLYGQSGVGKSSLLEAGLLPRLKWTHQISGARRDQLRGLVGTLENALSGLSSGGDSVIAGIWKDVERKSGKPLLLWLDQIEEIWTHADRKSQIDTEQELGKFLNLCDALFGKNMERPRGKLLLGFRKEFLPEVTTGLERHQLPYVNWFLEPMKRQSVAEVVLGLTRTERLRRQYRLRVEPNLDQTIMERVCSDPRSPVAPTLQVFMTRLWAAAVDKNQGHPLWDRELLATIEEKSDYLLDFLDRQLARVAKAFPEEEASGLVLDILEFYTTDVATSKERSRSDVAQEYANVESARLTALLNELSRCRLIADTGDTISTSVPDTPRTRLVHDTLAPRVRARFDQSERSGQRARRILEARVRTSISERTSTNDDPVPLSSVDLAVIKSGRAGMRDWTKSERELIAISDAAEGEKRAQDQRRIESQQRAEKAALEEAGRRRNAERRTRRALQLIAVMLLVGVFSSLALWWRTKQESLTRSRSLAESLFAATEGDMSGPVDVTHALLGISQALHVAPADWPRRDVYVARAAHLSHLSPKSVIPLGGTIASAALSRDAKKVLVFRDNGVGEIRDGQSGSLLVSLEPPGRKSKTDHESQALNPTVSYDGHFAAALIPANDPRGGTLILAWDCSSGHLWLQSTLSHDLAIQPDAIELSVNNDGWVIARLPTMAYDLGGTPYWTSSATAQAWHYNPAVTPLDRPPDSTWTGRGLHGEFALDPLDGTRLAFIPEAAGSSRHPESLRIDEVHEINLATNKIETLDVAKTSLVSYDRVSAMAWSADSRFVVLSLSSGDKDSRATIYVYDTVQKKVSQIPSGMAQSEGEIYDVSSSSAVTIARKLDGDKAKLLVWPLHGSPNSKEVEIHTVQIAPSKVRFVALGPRDESLVTVGDEEIRIIDVRTGAPLQPTVVTAGKMIAAALVASRNTLVTLSRDGILSKWDVGSDPTTAEVTSTSVASSQDPGSQAGSFEAATFSPDTSRLVVVARKQRGYEAGVVNIATDQTLGSPLYPSSWISIGDLFKDPSGEFRNFRSLGYDSNGHLSLGVLTILGQPREMLVASGGQPCVLSLSPLISSQKFTSDAHTLVTCHATGCELMDALTCKRKDRIPEVIPSASLNTNFLESALASSQGADTTPNTAAIHLTFNNGGWHTSSALNMASRSVWVDDATQLQITPPLAGTADPHPRTLAASPDGRSIAVLEAAATYSNGRRAEFGAWDAITGRPLTLDSGKKWPANSSVHASAFTPDGQWLFSLTSDNTLRRQWVLGHDSSTEWVEDAAKALTGYKLVNDILVPLDASQLSESRQRAIQKASAAASHGDRAAGIVLDALQRSDVLSSK